MGNQHDEQLTQSILSIKETLDGLANEMQKNAISLGTSQVTLSSNEKKIDKLYNLVLEGNGNSLMTRINLMEEKTKGLNRNINKLSDLIALNKEKSDKLKSENTRGQWNLINAMVAGVTAIIIILLKSLIFS